MKSERVPDVQPARGRFALPRTSAAIESALHPRPSAEPPWRLLPLVLGLAFAVRAAVALGGDFVLHPDEIMQYLEPAHRLVFGNGITFWEFHYGARSWIVPGLVAGVLKLFDAVGLGQPFWYVGGVKLAFCAISLVIPAGMYFFARHHFGETAARAALLAGAFWYELVGFAHKPMTEFVSTAALVALLVLCARPGTPGGRTLWPAALLAALASAIRLQYAPLAFALLAIVFLRTERKMRLVLAAAGFALAAGVFDALAWDGGLFHSYVTNIRFNLILGPMRSGESPALQFLGWLAVAGAGLSLLCVALASPRPGRYGFLLALIALVIVLHSLQAHKEYRFVFVVVPLWLLIGADLAARAMDRLPHGRWIAGAGAVLAAIVSAAGILNALPYQELVYRAWSNETGVVGFVRNQDRIFAAYRHLAAAPGVRGVWQVDRPHYRLPGYYYLHREVPFYDTTTRNAIHRGGAKLADVVSHVVTEDPDLDLPGYSMERAFGTVRILRRDANDGPVRRWAVYQPILVDELTAGIIRRIDPDALPPPRDAGIRFRVEDPPRGSGEGEGKTGP